MMVVVVGGDGWMMLGGRWDLCFRGGALAGSMWVCLCLCVSKKEDEDIF